VGVHRFFAPIESGSFEQLRLGPSETHHCRDVLRLGIGSRVVVFNGQGAEAIAEIRGFDNVETRLSVIQVHRSEPLRCAITLGQAIPKGKNMELILQKATELGVSRIVPLLSERTVIQMPEGEDGKRVEKWRQVVIEAAKQCGQNWLPTVGSPISLKRFFAEFDRHEVALIASLQQDARSFKRVLSDFREHHGRRPTSTVMLIGPEGDFTPAESALAKTVGCLPVSLGPIVLRTETAAIYSLSVLAYELQGHFEDPLRNEMTDDK
jgi:16S rRNA (uracil1498-N3)-methyltransferase